MTTFVPDPQLPADYDPADYDSAVALVGMSGRFPGAADVTQLWHNLAEGISGLREISDDELTAAGVDTSSPNYVRVGGPVAGLDQFDAAAFGMNPREVEAMEPHHRMFLECSWEALEAAGYPPVEPGLPVGVFGGCAFPDYMIDNVSHLTQEPGGMLLFAVGNERDSLTSLVSYKLGLSGPSLTVQTFCSTSLVAVHLACQSLLTFECDLALAGGAFLPLPQPTGYLYEPGSILSPDGQVRSFGADANGSVMGSGVGVVALKRMADALADGDVIHAVILGSATNNDGRDKAGYTAPGLDGQASVIETALTVAGVKPESIGYVECHATGTQLGDSIELAAMSRAFPTVPATPCVLSSLKPSIGHLDRASGVAGLMRATLNLRHAILPGTPGYTEPNPTLAAHADLFTVLPENRPWPAGPEPRRAGVSSFGLGGTNAHVVLEEAPTRPTRAVATGPQLLCFSAGDPSALAEVGTRLRDHLAAHPDLDLADVAYTLQMSRGHFALRRAIVVTDYDDALAALADPTRCRDGRAERRDPAVCAPSAEVADELIRLGITVADDGLPVSGGVLDGVAQAWLAGASVDWAELHDGVGRRVELPTYPFQRSRYWVDAVPRRISVPRVEGRVDDPGQWTYLPTWVQWPQPIDDLDARLRAAGPWLVFSDDPRGDALVARLETAGAEVTAVRPGAELAQDDAGHFVAAPTDVAQLSELLRSLFVAPRTIVHALSLGAETDSGAGSESGTGFDAAQQRGFYSVLALVRALAEDAQTPPTDLVLLTGGAVGVLSADLDHPEQATLVGLTPSLAQENPGLSARHIDLIAISDIETVLSAAVGAHDGPVAVRDGQAWLRHYEPHQLATPSEPAPTQASSERPSCQPASSQPPLFRRGDTVLITGGLGDVGLVLARHLARTYGCRLVLTARTPLPPRAEWDIHIDSDSRAARHIRTVRALEAEGASVLAVAADVADEAAMRAVVEQAVATFGAIDVVVHGAGVQDPAYFGLAHLAERDVCEAHLRAKVGGLRVLQTVLGSQAPLRRITLSSISAVLGGIALGPYSAANAAMDAYARHARHAGLGRWITVDWDTWSVDEHRLDSYGGQTARDYEMAPSEGISIFERALAAGDRIPHLVISTGPLEVRLAQWVTNGSALDAAAADTVRHPRPDISTPYIEPAEGLERTIADVWAETLALDEVGALDNFFELGGHSLIAIQLNARLRAAASASLPVTALVEYPTVRQLAELIACADSGAPVA